jgi:hypothetical protein
MWWLLRGVCVGVADDLALGLRVSGVAVFLGDAQTGP